MTANSSDLLDPGVFFAPMPILFLDAGGMPTDSNLAARVLLGPRVPDLCCSPAVNSQTDPSARGASSQGSHLPAADAPGAMTFRHRTPEYGWATLNRRFVRHFDADSGELQRTTLYLEVLDLDKKEEYRRALDWEHRHQSLWDNYAISYDRVLPRLSFYREAVARHVEFIRDRHAADVLDLGAGTGNVSLELLDGTLRIVALDVSRAMLTKLSDKCPKSQWINLTLVEQSAEDLSRLHDGKFDAVTILLALYDMAHPARALDEAIRVLSPGGGIVITEPKRNFDVKFLIARAEEGLRADNLYHTLKADWHRVTRINLELDPGKRDERLFIEDVVARLEKHGVRIESIADSHHGTCATVRAIKAEAQQQGTPANA